MILRLIDIVLIVLFGFISMATIEGQRKVDLAETASVRAHDASTGGNVTVSVDAWGDMYIQEELAAANLDQVVAFLDRQAAGIVQGDSTHVRIRADEAAPMATVQTVVNVCDSYGLPRSLIVVYEGEAAP